jgi:hypothetical protein
MTASRPTGNAEMARDRTEASSIEGLASRRLAESCHYSHHFKYIGVSYRDGALILRGCLPSFYLKQILQTLLQGLEGVERIDNQVEVAGSTALAADRTTSGSGLAGLDRIRNVQELLTDPATPLEKRLHYAGVEFLAASRYDDEWPAELRTTANRIKVRLLSNSDLSSSIQAMDDATLEETAEELLLFTKAAERLAACSQAAT